MQYPHGRWEENNGAHGVPESSKLLSCYAPTFAASRAEKDNFVNYLQEALDEIPPNETYVILGDFNACVGSREPAEEDYWGKSRGPHGFGKMNDAGKELLAKLPLSERSDSLQHVVSEE